MEIYLCLDCSNTWEARVEKYQDWHRRQCPKCRRRTTVKKNLFDRAVAEYAKSLEYSPPPHKPHGSAVTAILKLLVDTFPSSSPVKVFCRVDRAARKSIKARDKKDDVEGNTVAAFQTDTWSLRRILPSIIPEVDFGNYENYLAVAFALMIDSMLCREPEIGRSIIAKIHMSGSEAILKDNEHIKVSAQPVFEQGLPDLKILGHQNLLIYVGVTLAVRLTVDQIDRYRKYGEALDGSPANIKCVALLTSPNFVDDERIPPTVRTIRLSEVYGWLADAMAKVNNPNVKNLISEFMSTLDEKQLVEVV